VMHAVVAGHAGDGERCCLHGLSPCPLVDREP
jgi:hypothetical protein